MEFDDWMAFEMCSGFGASAEVGCPHCGASLSVETDDAAGEEIYKCPQCEGEFVIDWDEQAGPEA